jgi:hypothetical protein
MHMFYCHILVDKNLCKAAKLSRLLSCLPLGRQDKHTVNRKVKCYQTTSGPQMPRGSHKLARRPLVPCCELNRTCMSALQHGYWYGIVPTSKF